MIQCASGHFFDEQRHMACPYCAQPFALPAKTMPMPAMTPVARTMPLGPLPPPLPAPPPPPMPGVLGGGGETVRLVREVKTGVDPAVGWLVCIAGPDRGRDFRMRTEKNFIGRDATNDVVLAGDDGVSRQKHAAVVFDPAKREFWLVPGESAGLVYRNEEAAHAPLKLRDRDVIGIGNSKLVVVTFVNDFFAW